MDAIGKLKARWTRSYYTAQYRETDEEEYICDICQKDLGTPSKLALHRNAHDIERPFRCEICQISFATSAQLQKHTRSAAHENRAEMTQAYGAPTEGNPRPYECDQCVIGFRKFGHLSKHLRSKAHITKLESNGLIPNGLYAALEKCDQEIKDRIVTTNCEQSLESLRSIASIVFQDMPSDLTVNSDKRKAQKQPDI
uniref:Transcription factor E4F1 n=1 Tax=Aceria tosichella TaxID=561515 RepID=A0A6G1SER5_9ACAR